MPNRYRTNKEIVFSTKHIKPETLAKLNHPARMLLNFGILIDPSEYKPKPLCKIFVRYDDKAKDSGLSELDVLMKIAKEQSCNWLVINKDGPVYDNLPTF